ncbi:MAG: hypothetical protein IT372_02130, partial [Polyangiaceae bacterium]|nr:hypothetical protein [Polyangiaceae bacterium]
RRGEAHHGLRGGLHVGVEFMALDRALVALDRGVAVPGGLRRAIAGRVAGERPLLALEHYTRLKDPGAIDAAKKIIDSFSEPRDAPSLWIEAEAPVERWIDLAAATTGWGDDGAAVKAKLATARKAHDDDAKLIEAGDEKAIAKALAARPGDQELAAALASLTRGQGDVKGAIATLAGLGPPGRLTAEAQQLLGACHSDAGDLAKADEILSGLLDERLPAFQEAQRAFFDAMAETQRRIMADLQTGAAPPDLDARMAGVTDEARQREIFQEWLGERMDRDPELARLRGEYLRHGAVVPASLMLGMVKLRRAVDARGSGSPSAPSAPNPGDAPGGERRALLDAAERAFLSIRREAAGEPTFHLGLGQVYHRLGRPADGDAELKGVLDRREPALSLAVARAYRELGLGTRARQVCEAIHADPKAEKVHKDNAAALIAHLVPDLDEQETWLKRSDTSAPEIRNLLDNVRAMRLLRAGKLAEADQALAKIARFHERDAKHSAVGANNAAVAYMSRFEATGDTAHLRSAVSSLEAAARLGADNALVLGNLASALQHLGEVTVLDRWVQIRTLLPDGRAASSVIDAMLEGPLRGEVLAALQREPAFQRSLEVTRQAQILAPQQTSAYEPQLEWLGWNADAKGFTELAKRLESMPPFDPEDVATERRKWERGERDEELKRQSAAALERARACLSRAERSGHKPTLAAAYLGLGEALSSKAYFEGSAALAGEMIDAYRSATQAWPEGVTDRELAGALVNAAIYKALPESPALKKAWDAERRVFGTAMLLHRAAAGPSGAEILAALRKQPELAEAARLRKASLGDRPSLTDWIIARIAGDSELEQAAAKVFDRADLGARLQIEARIYPGQPREKADIDLFTSRGK